MKKWRDIIIFFVYFNIIKVGFTKFYEILKIKIRIITDISLFNNQSLAFIPIFIGSFLFTMYLMNYKSNLNSIIKNRLGLLNIR